MLPCTELEEIMAVHALDLLAGWIGCRLPVARLIVASMASGHHMSAREHWLLVRV
jgi:hypothetical protein